MIQEMIKAYFSSLSSQKIMELLGGPERVVQLLIEGLDICSPESREKLRRSFLGESSDVITLKVQKIDKEAKFPRYSYKGDAGLDIYSAEDLVIPPGEIKPVRIGLKMALPDTHFALIKGKTGLALNSSIIAAAEVFDPNYRGEFHAILLNFGKNPYEVKKGQKIAQFIVLRKVNVVIEETEDLGSTERGKKRFGSSGLD